MAIECKYAKFDEYWSEKFCRKYGKPLRYLHCPACEHNPES